jgi:hypothetical protein
MCAATIVLEGREKDELIRTQKKLHHIAAQFEGIVGGAESGKRGTLAQSIYIYIIQYGYDRFQNVVSFEIRK